MDKYQSLNSSEIEFPTLEKLKETDDGVPIVHEVGGYDPCLTATNICQNKGKCINRNGQFICECPPTHFGKRCERVADTRYCKDHKCQNGGTCLSTNKPQTFVDPILLRKYRSNNNDLSSLISYENITITIQYQCICMDGFLGEFCHISEDERKCEEDYCSSHGRGHYETDSGCSCECDPNEWIGEKCDIRSPCADYDCMNTSNCTLKYHEKENAVEAICNCSSDSELIKINVEGDHCEKIETDDEESIFLPCQPSTNYRAWYNAMNKTYIFLVSKILKLKDVDRDNLEMIEKSCKKMDGSSCRIDNVLSNGWCYYEGKCNVRLEKFDSGKFYLVPYCECKGAESGRFCEYHRKDQCDPTAIESEGGITRENRCTSLQNGVCIAPEGIALCDCFPGYVGEKCEVYDPCARNPCGKATDCVAMPDEIEEKGDLSAQNYRCLCGMADSIDEGNTVETKCIYSGTGNCSKTKNPCNNGECLSCEYEDEEDILQLCNEEEKRDGFRCICEPGFLPPYCEKIEDACHNHLCLNGAQCVAKSAFNYDCKCLPGTFGTLCEYVTDHCEAIGNRVCINGNCYEDPTTTRQFSCYCRYMFHGRNCELRKKHDREMDGDHPHQISIRERKLKIALEHKYNIIRKKVIFCLVI
ncbi:EGF-like domain protein [Dictyocaulus viviparus]|uniref:EGF-like domain protein n=1 Tax=Dictyocaulus viviparus TaxID=29172 RepID=A0A0D8XWB6_DICVI|nr:EGF-like domain protein [Dictyocaulus viviparus]